MQKVMSCVILRVSKTRARNCSKVNVCYSVKHKFEEYLCI